MIGPVEATTVGPVGPMGREPRDRWSSALDRDARRTAHPRSTSDAILDSVQDGFRGVEGGARVLWARVVVEARVPVGDGERRKEVRRVGKVLKVRVDRGGKVQQVSEVVDLLERLLMGNEERLERLLGGLLTVEASGRSLWWVGTVEDAGASQIGGGLVQPGLGLIRRVLDRGRPPCP